MVWSQHAGVRYATIVLKATLELQHGRLATLLPPKPVIWCDKPRASGALERADESVPFSGGGSVLVHGFVYAQAASEREPAFGRVWVGSDRPMVDKVIAVERSGRTPLLWEQALLTHENPAGTPHPSLVNPKNRDRTIGLGPIASSWSPRFELISGPIGVREQVLELPDRFDPRFFNAAPPDQQCRPFQGNEGIVLVNLVPKVPELRSWLPALSVGARVAINGVAAQPAFFLDTLTIDAETRVTEVVWRAVLTLPPGSQMFVFEAVLNGRFEAAPEEAAPETQQAPEVFVPPQPIEAPAPIAAPPRAPRVTASPPPALERFDDPRRAVMDRLKSGASLDDLDLEGADLSGLDLSMRSLGRTKLDGATLKGANLKGANLWSASLAGADLSGARFENADLEGANLTKARAQKSSFVRALLTGATLVKARFDGAVLDEADLSDCNASGVAFMETKLRRVKANRAKLDRALLVHADFQDAALDFAVLEKCSLDDASFDGASLTDADLTQCVADRSSFVKARLARAKLAKVRLTSAVMTGADLTGANLEGADLSGAHLDGALLDRAHVRGAKLVGAVLNGASLQGTDFGGADLTGARLTKTDRSSANLEGAKLAGVVE